MHGKQSQIRFWDSSVLYQGIEDNRPVMRYHCILIEEMPEEFEVIELVRQIREAIKVIRDKPADLAACSIIQKV